MPVDSDELTRLRVALAKISREMTRQVPGGDMSPTQVAVLGTIVRIGPVGVGELADLEGLNPTMLSRMAGKLEAAGLVVRTPDPSDGRAVVVSATRAGRALHERLRKRRSALLAERLERIPEGQAEQLVKALPALEALADAMRLRPAGVTR
jgi:DNA-binding MarR family transcriptional regulator